MAAPEHYRTLSMALSEVLNNVGVNKKVIMKLRKKALLDENGVNLAMTAYEGNESKQRHIFGSQSEGTTTIGLNSDTDMLFVLKEYRCIQNWKDWTNEKANLLMLQAPQIYPGYCILQLIRKDAPLPETNLIDDNFTYDETKRVILKNTIFSSDSKFVKKFMSFRGEQHGPAVTFKREIEIDYVFGFACKTWPRNFKRWTENPIKSQWPTKEMCRYIESSGCIMVPVGHRLDSRPECSWRISTSHAERCLMFSFNIVQIRCFIILKMFTKTFIDPHVPDVISSYICKTLLFHAIEGSSRTFWRDANLLYCVNRILLYMLASVMNMNCPNYFNGSANLLYGKLNYNKQAKLAHVIKNAIQGRGSFLFEIVCDDLGTRLENVLTKGPSIPLISDSLRTKYGNFTNYTLEACGIINKDINEMLKFTQLDRQRGLHGFRIIQKRINKGSPHVNPAVLYLPFLCSHLATILACEKLSCSLEVSDISLLLYNLSLNSDFGSSKLKYASFLLVKGEHKRVIQIVRELRSQFNKSVTQQCGCYSGGQGVFNGDFHRFDFSHGQLRLDKVAFCVRFMRDEMLCCPFELRYEFFRDLKRDEEGKYPDWTYLAAMDFTPFLVYLEYIACRLSGDVEGRQNALRNFVLATHKHPNMGHRDAAFNVLGQCMEWENRPNDALECYRRSVQIRKTNTAVRWHIARLVFNQIQSPKR